MDKNSNHNVLIEQYKWDLTPLYKSNNDWQKNFNELFIFCEAIRYNINIYNYEELTHCLYYIRETSEKLYAYMKLKKDENIFDVETNNLYNICFDFICKVSEILYVIEARLQGDAASELHVNNVYPKIEQITNGFNKAFGTFFNDITFDDVLDGNAQKCILNPSLYNKYMHSSDRVLRRNSFFTFHNAYSLKSESIAKKLYKIMKNNIVTNRKSNQKSCLEATLNAEGLDVNTYHNVINTINNHLADVEKYNQAKKIKMGVRNFYLYDLLAPIYTNTFCGEFNHAKEVIFDSLSIFGSEYINILNKVFHERWIDIYYDRNKLPMSYSFDIYHLHPYILLNYHGEITDIFTLAHELGHAVHYYFADREQNYKNSRIRSLTAEVAALVNEVLTYEYLIRKFANDESIISLYIDKFRSACFKQVLLAEFEEISYDIISKGEILTSNDYTKIYKRLLRKYYKGVAITSKGEYEWARVPHFCKRFHVYKYAIAFCIAINIALKMYDDNKMKMIFMNYLKSGNLYSLYDLMKNVGIDITKNDYLENALNYLSLLINKFEKQCENTKGIDYH